MTLNRKPNSPRAHFDGADVGDFSSFLPGILLSWLGKDNASSFFYASLVFSVLCAVMLTLVWCFTWERPREAWSEAACGRKRKNKT